MKMWYVLGISEDDAVVYSCDSKLEAVELCDRKSDLLLDWEFMICKPVYSTVKVKVNV